MGPPLCQIGSARVSCCRGFEGFGAGDALEEALKALEAMNAKNWRKQRDVAAGFIRRGKELGEAHYGRTNAAFGSQ